MDEDQMTPEAVLCKYEKDLNEAAKKRGWTIRAYLPITERGDNGEKTEHKRLTEYALKNVIWNTTYFAQYPNPNNNPRVNRVCQRMLTRSLGNAPRHNDSIDAFAKGNLLPVTASPTRGRGEKWTLLERLDTEVNQLPEATSEDEREEAESIFASMRNEMQFYDDLRQTLRELPDRAIDHFRKLIPIWVAKQDQSITWTGEKTVNHSSWANMQKNFFGNPLFIPQRWLELAEGKEIICNLIQSIRLRAREAARGRGESWQRQIEGQIDQYEHEMIDEWNEYVRLAEQMRASILTRGDGESESNYIGIGNHLRETPVRELFENFESDVEQGVYSEALQHKANFVFGLYMGTLLGPQYCCEHYPFPVISDLTSGETASRKLKPEEERPLDEPIDITRAVTISIQYDTLGNPSPQSKTLGLRLEDCQPKMLSLVAGREIDASKWDDLKTELAEVIRSRNLPEISFEFLVETTRNTFRSERRDVRRLSELRDASTRWNGYKHELENEPEGNKYAESLITQIEECIEVYVENQFAKPGAKIYRNTLLDFVRAGFINWARDANPKKLIEYIDRSISEFTEFERKSSLAFGPTEYECGNLIRDGVLDEDEYIHAGVPAHRHLLFYYNEDSELALTCLDSHNGALLTQLDANVFLISGNCDPKNKPKKRIWLRKCSRYTGTQQSAPSRSPCTEETASRFQCKGA